MPPGCGGQRPEELPLNIEVPADELKRQLRRLARDRNKSETNTGPVAGATREECDQPGECKGCGHPLPPQRRPGVKRVWCSDWCRKRGYDPKAGTPLEGWRR